MAQDPHGTVDDAAAWRWLRARGPRGPRGHRADSAAGPLAAAAGAGAGAGATDGLDGAGDGAAAHGAGGDGLGHQLDAKRQQCLGPRKMGRDAWNKWGETEKEPIH